MEAKRIMAVLQGNAELGEKAAKVGFLQWMLTLPEGASIKEAARRALSELPEDHLTLSATEFRACLEACTWSVSAPRRRKRRLLN